MQEKVNRIIMLLLLLIPLKSWGQNAIIDLTTEVSSNVNTSQTITNLPLLYDNDINSACSINVGCSITWEFKNGIIPQNYTITNFDDAQFDPKSLLIETSIDGVNWTSYHNLSYQSFSDRKLTRTFTPITTTNVVRYIRFTINGVNGGAYAKLSEFHLYGVEKEIPNPLKTFRAKAISAFEANLSWKKPEGNFATYQIERSGDGVNYSNIANISSENLNYIDSNLSPEGFYIYRICTSNDLVNSSFISSEMISTPKIELPTSAFRSIKFSITDKDGKTGSEGADKVADGKEDTKFLCYNSSTWIRANLETAVKALYYSLTSANDDSTRDPKSWILQGSNNGSSWTQLDIKNNEIFPGRFQTKTYKVTNTNEYKYYRLNITENMGSSMTQLAEWDLHADLPPIATNEGEPNAPTNFNLTVRSYNQIWLTWNDNADNEDNYKIEISTDGNTWKLMDTTPKNTTAWCSWGLQGNTRYYYRLFAENENGQSGYSNIIDTTTPDDSWPERWDNFNFDSGYHTGNLELVYSNEHIGIYLNPADNILRDGKTIEWCYQPFTDMWRVVKETYPTLSDPKLYIVLHYDASGGGLGRLYHYRDEQQLYRNIVHVTLDGDWTAESTSGFKYDVLSHEIAHIIEGCASTRKYSVFFGVWMDSKWAEIFQYDIFKKMNPTRAASWHAKYMNADPDNFPSSNSYWYSKFFYPAYEKYGEGQLYVRFFELLGLHYRQQNMELNESGTLGELIHFLSAAANADLQYLAKDAFGWNDKWEMELMNARVNYPFDYPIENRIEKTTINILRNGGILNTTPALDNTELLNDGNLTNSLIITEDKVNIHYVSPEAASIFSYTIKGNRGASSRLKGPWILYGANDDNEWEIIHNQPASATSLFISQDGVYAYNHTLEEQSSYYTQFKLEIENIDNCGIIEIEMYGIQSPSHPNDLQIHKLNESTLYIDWDAPLTKETLYFEIERSTDGINFIKIGEADYNEISYTDTDIHTGNYYYRIRAINTNNISPYSNIANINITSSTGVESLNVKSIYELLSNLSQYPKNRIKIYSTDGVLVYDKHHNNSEWSQLNANALFNKGTYIIHIDLGNGSAPLRSKLILK